ncbi:MAG TPA: penicillin acylase family protein [Trebonia sp.]|nr:penicillin acylase family protein [Trebonia sp.]
MLNAAVAVVVSVALLGVLGFGYGTIPALGPALDPGRGAWTSASGGQPASSQTLRVPGLTAPVPVSFSSQGLASIDAANTHDLFVALGYVHAKFRLSEMDLERRLGEGRLAQLAGPSDLSSDEFELRLGLLRTAQNEWARTTGQARAALLAYAQGVNDDIAAVRAAGDWPAVFTLTGTYPGPWTPVDSLVVQGVLTQELDYTTGPLDEAVLARTLGAASTADWFPVLAKNAQTPYDPGPYVKAPLTPLAPDAASSAPGGSITTTASVAPGGRPPGIPPRTGGSSPPVSPSAVAAAAAQLLDQLSQLPANQIHQYPDSNAWAANGPAVATNGGSRGAVPPGKQSGALLGGDPHLPQTEPSAWYEVALSAPGYQVSGVSVPGLPGILLGHNANIAWSLTDTQNAATRYYAERVRGGSYYWDGAWRPMTVVHYTIPVRGGATVNLAVDITVHGPIMTQVGQRMAVDWMGNVPSDDVAALFGINEATDFAQFRAALTGWRTPTQNFVYADKAGNIGVIAPGYYPQVAAGCQPWLPMPGTGACDVTGVIPFQAVPQVYDPPSHLIVTANQRPVTAAYPYYIGTSDDFYDPGYRAAYAYTYLASHEPLSAASVAALQNNVTDSLASRVLPSLLTALGTASLSSSERTVVSLLSSWNYAMDTGSAAATVWWTFWDDYLTGVFEPWWKAGKVPVGRDVDGLGVGPGQAPLDEDLEAWTLNDPSNAAFRGPSGRGPGSAPAAMVAAFRQAVTHLSAKFGGSPSTWTWDREHSRSFPSVEDATGLGYGPRAAGGDPFTEDAADGGLTATTGPSWRMIVSFDAGGLSAVGVYPGGQSENPASPWYTNLVPLWWDGRYLPLPAPG